MIEREGEESAANYTWAATALRRGHSREDVEQELERVSLKAASLSRGARKGYLIRTVKAASREAG